ncbi:hypothetical protein BROUX41_003038 [Berkeleyomyces rouxiae]|uniref:uncharacterized protein n=1 Tax=Berkeleyomyces rouxiae TaxID=2035830 RepID=UPI003B7616F1
MVTLPAFSLGRSDDYSLARPLHFVSHENYDGHNHGHRQHPNPPSHELPASLLTDEARDMAQRAADTASIPQKRLVIPDPVAFRYLGDDPIVNIIESCTTLEGYELYLVEQWACSRKSASTVIASYTGDAKSTVVVGVISVPADEASWSLRLKMFFREVQQFQARPRETSLGDLITTNLSSFPSTLTPILVPDGDIRSYQKMFIVNENLKRLGCSGRAGLTLDEPAPAVQAKFCSMYRVHEQINFMEAAIELVRLCQMALVVFGQLNPIFSDGLLCDITEVAISNWWADIGVEYYNMEPSDGILGPMTISALLGLLMGARNRLNSFGAAVSKDAFDIENTMRGVSHFQKCQKMERTGLLDRQTLLKLQSATAKAAANEGWAVQRAVKSTVAEIGGKRGELVMGIVSRDKGGISEVETLDIEKFIGFAYGELPKWLWHGKARRSATESSHEKHAEIGSALMAAKEQQEIFQMASQRSSSIPISDYADSNNGKEELHGVPSQTAISGPFLTTSISQENANEKGEKKTRFRSVTERMSDARSGLGRIKDAVGGSRRVPKPGRDDYCDVPSSPVVYYATGPNGGPIKAYNWNRPPESCPTPSHQEKDLEQTTIQLPLHNDSDAPPDKVLGGTYSESLPGDVDARDIKGSPYLLASTTGVRDIHEQWLGEDEAVNLCMKRLQRRRSFHTTKEWPPLHDARWPRRASFSDAANAVLRWEDIAPMVDIFHPSSQAFSLFELAQVFYGNVQSIKRDLEPWAQDQFVAFGNLEDTFIHKDQDLRVLRDRLVEAHENMALSTSSLMTKERSTLSEEIKELETLFARLDYEVQGLAGKVADVEDGVEVFERQVNRLEEKAEELRTQLETESWIHWLVRTVTGIGTGPNILQEVDRRMT